MPSFAGTGRRIVSWLEEALQEQAQRQPRQTGKQLLRQLEKNPRVNMEEVKDRRLRGWLEDRADDRIDLTADENNPLRFLEEEQPLSDFMPKTEVVPDPEYQDYAIPGLDNYQEIVHGGFDPRVVGPDSSHFGDRTTLPYAFHTREGMGPQGNYVLSEAQSDIGSNYRNKAYNSALNSDYRTYDDLKAMGEQIGADYGLNQPPGPGVAGMRTLGELIGDVGDAAAERDGLIEYDQMLQSSIDDKFNLPATKSYPWQGLANAIMRADEAGAQYISWPTPETQAMLQSASLAPDAEFVKNNLPMYQKIYDKGLTRNPNWKQMGVTPERHKLWGRFEVDRVPLADIPMDVPLYGLGGAALMGALTEEDIASGGGYF